MKEAVSPVELWLNLLTRLPKWNVDKSILYLLNVLARIGWLQHNDAFKGIISTMLNEANVYRPSKGLASRVRICSVPSIRDRLLVDNQHGINAQSINLELCRYNRFGVHTEASEGYFPELES